MYISSLKAGTINRQQATHHDDAVRYYSGITSLIADESDQLRLSDSTRFHYRNRFFGFLNRADKAKKDLYLSTVLITFA